MSRLFTDIDELKPFVNITAAYDFVDLDASLGLVEEEEIVRYIGRPQFEQLATAYDSSTMTPEETSLLAKVRLPLANFALSMEQFTNALQESASGSSSNETPERKPATPLQIARRKKEIIKKSYKGIDVLIDFLQRNKDDYPLWVSSEAYVYTKELFIQTTDQLKKHLSIPRSHALYIEYMPFLKDREKVVRTRIGKAFFDELKEQVLTDTLTTENELIVVDYIRPAMAYLSHEKAVALLALVNPFGVYVFEELSLDPSAKVKEALDKAKDSMRAEMKTQYGETFDELHQFLYENIDDYPTYRDSSAYTAPETEEEAENYGKVDTSQPNAKVGYI